MRRGREGQTDGKTDLPGHFGGSCSSACSLAANSHVAPGGRGRGARRASALNSCSTGALWREVSTRVRNLRRIIPLLGVRSGYPRTLTPFHVEQRHDLHYLYPYPSRPLGSSPPVINHLTRHSSLSARGCTGSYPLGTRSGTARLNNSYIGYGNPPGYPIGGPRLFPPRT